MPPLVTALLDFFKANKDAFQGAQAIVTIIGIIAGGLWARSKFGLKREKFPRAKLGHKFDLVPIDADRRILRVELSVENLGDTLVEIKWVLNRIQQVFPIADTAQGKFDPRPSQAVPEIDWPMIDERKLEFRAGHREVEPKEPDAFHFDYDLAPEVETVVVYSYVRNARKKRRLFSWKAPKELGWMKTDTLHLERALIFPMSKAQPSNPPETRQGAPKVTPTQTTSGGAASAQSEVKPAPVTVVPKPN